MKKALISFVTAFAIVLSAGMSMAHPLDGYDHQTSKAAGPGFHLNSELSSSDPCDSCTDAWG